jgi:heat shock protein HtpX
MWEQIRANRIKSFILVICMALMLMLLGAVIGGAVSPRGGGAITGIAITGIVWFFLTMLAYSNGSRILMAASSAKKIEKKDHPQLFNIVEEMTIAAGLPKMPDIYVMDDMSINAFAAGRDPDNAVIAVTAGLLGKLNRDQIQGVVAHEMSHIKNRDVLFMTLLGVMLGVIVIISEIFMRSLWYSSMSGRRNRNSSSKGGGQAQAVMMVLAIVFAILAPILAQIIYFASSRRREYLADASGALITRYPEGLASALETIMHESKPMAKVSKAIAPMYISNPLKMNASGLTSTHPPLEERIRILRSMAGGVSYNEYQQAWQKVSGRNAGSLPASALSGGVRAEARDASADVKKPDPRQQMRQVTDVLRKVNKFMFLACPCGLQFKIPPEFKGEGITCPRCGRDNKVALAQLMATEQIADAIDSQTKGQPPKQT